MSTQAGPAKFFEGLLPKSRMALSMGLAILEQQGMEGWVTIYLPPDQKAPCEIITTTHGWTMSLTPEAFRPGGKR